MVTIISVDYFDKGGHGSPMHSQPRVSNTAILAVLLASQSGVLWCPCWSQCSNNGWQETTVLFQRATVSALGGWTSEDGERYSAVCQENVVCVQFGSFLCRLFCSFGFRSPVCLNVAHCFNFVSRFGTTTGLEMTKDTIPLLLNAVSMCFIL